MATVTDFITNFGQVVELDFPKWDISKVVPILLNHKEWKEYQPHKKPNNRYGLSVTSLDGEFSGEPDLFSLREYYKMTGKGYNEGDFRKRTQLVNMIPELNPMLDFFEPSVGRAHFLKLNKGGFFPPHRDNGTVVISPTFRILVPIFNMGVNDMKWIQEDKILHFDLGSTYFINTTRIHSVFSFVDNCMMLVLNVISNSAILDKMVKKVVAI